MGVEDDTVWNRLERAKRAPDGHQEEKAQINQRANLRHQVKHGTRWLRTQITKHQEVYKEDAIQNLVPTWPITDRFDWTVVEPRQQPREQQKSK